MSDGNYVTTRKASQYYDVHPSTLRRWDSQGKIKTIRVSNRRRYFIPHNQDILNSDVSSNEKQKICYCRVSSSNQKNDLQRQIEYMRTKFPHHTIIQDVASGIKWKRKGLKTILELAMSGKLKELVVAYRDRLCRFGFELVQWILETNNCKLVVLDETIQTREEELTNDLLSIIHIFNCRQMGMRRYKEKKERNDYGGKENKILSNK